MAQADTSGVMLYKVDANSDGVFLKKAKFNIYIWNEDAGPNGEGAYIIVNHPDSFELDEDMGVTDFVTNQSGMIVIDGSTIAKGQFAYNTAYYIVERESPEGYYLSPEPYYFQIVHPELDKYPRCQPDDFAGALLSRGDIIYRENVSATTEISVEKYWKSYNGANMTVTGKQVSEVNLELWQELEGDPNSAKIYGTYKMTPDEKGNWSLTITGLPKATKKADGTKDKDYLYYIKEVSVSGFTLESSENNGGINSGIIKLVNRELEGYELPETGGAGTQLYTTAGLLLMLTSAAFLTYINVKRRREAL
jgi:LPXTG-motif cell wall-anchored protein